MQCVKRLVPGTQRSRHADKISDSYVQLELQIVGLP